MGDAKIVQDLELKGELIALAGNGLPEHSGIVVVTRTMLDGAYEPAQLGFARAVQSYADRLAIESANQEKSEKAPGVSGIEITESAMLRAQQALDEKVALEIRKRDPLDPYALAGSPIFSGATGVMGSFLHSLPQVIVFSALAVIAIACVLHTARRGLK